jgi:hypothetical protein
MPPHLSQFVNRMILISIPALYEDGKCRPYKLVSVEMHGLWLVGEDLTNRLLDDRKPDLVSATWIAFVPFAQIAAVFVATPGPVPPQVSRPEVDTNVPSDRTSKNIHKHHPSSTHKTETREKHKK